MHQNLEASSERALPLFPGTPRLRSLDTITEDSSMQSLTVSGDIFNFKVLPLLMGAILTAICGA